MPADRFSKNNFVDQVVDMFNKNDSFAIALSPEGTRKKVERLRTRFYHIAQKAHVPIVMLALDFEQKEFHFAAPFFTTDDAEEDMKRIIHFLADLKDKIPALSSNYLEVQKVKSVN